MSPAHSGRVFLWSNFEAIHDPSRDWEWPSVEAAVTRALMLFVIIPTRNSAGELPGLLKQLSGERVIVADGGSTDDTLRTALDHGAQVAIGRSGRGRQLRTGAQLALHSGQEDDWFLFLHADSRLPKTWRVVVERAIARGVPRYFRFKARGGGLRGWWLSRLVNFRCWGWGLPYGDQGLLISRTDYEAVGGYDLVPLFEDVAIVERLPRILPLTVALETDISAHLRDGLWGRGLRNLALLRDYRAGVSPDELAERYK